MAGERVGVQAVCISKEGGIPCGWKGPIRTGKKDGIQALDDGDAHEKETVHKTDFGGIAWHTTSLQSVFADEED